MCFGKVYSGHGGGAAQDLGEGWAAVSTPIVVVSARCDPQGLFARIASTAADLTPCSYMAEPHILGSKKWSLESFEANGQDRVEGNPTVD